MTGRRCQANGPGPPPRAVAGPRSGAGRRTAVVAGLVALAALLSGCQAGLRPAPEATVLPGRRAAAVAQSEGVRIVAEPGAWWGEPRDLEGLIMPLLVTIENTGSAPLRLRYDAFALLAPDGRRYAALPPFDIRGEMTEAIDPPFSPYHPYYAPGGRFRPGPPFRRHYPGWASYRGPFAYDPWYYDRHYPAFRRVLLPTADMVQMALPEGVLEPGGRVTGFLYFEGVPSRVPRIVFTAALVDARTSAAVGTVTIPFVAA